MKIVQNKKKSSFINKLLGVNTYQTSKFVIILGNSSLFFLSILLVFIVGGIITKPLLTSMNYIQDRYRIDEYRIPYPYIMFKGSNTYFDHNEGGYRGPYPSKIKPDNEYRIIVLGGSTVYIGDPTITQLLQEEFHTNGYTNVQVYNFGVISDVSSQELMTIVTEIAQLHPDLIVQYDGANDLYHPLFYDPRPGYPFDFMAYEMSPLLYPKKFPALKFLIYQNSFIRYIAERLFPNQYINQFLPLNTLRDSVGFGSDEWRQQIVDTYVANIDKANKIAHAFGSQYVAIFQPTIYTKKTLSSEELQVILQADIVYFTKATNQVLEKISDGGYNDVHFTDLTKMFETTDTTVFSDVMHVFQENQPTISHAIYQSILSTITIPRP